MRSGISYVHYLMPYANLVLITVNISSLTHFLHPAPSWALPLFLFLTELAPVPRLRTRMQLIALLSLAAAITTAQNLSNLLGVCALGIAMNVGCRLGDDAGNLAVNMALGLGIMFGSMTEDWLGKYGTARDILLVICTLPNVFMSEFELQSEQPQPQPNTAPLKLVNPFYDRSWPYALGFTLGLVLPLPPLAKSSRFLLIALLLLLNIFTKDTSYGLILSILRGVLIYNENVHWMELYFLVGYIVMDLLLREYAMNYLFVGYLVIGVVLRYEEMGDRLERGDMEREMLELRDTED